MSRLRDRATANTENTEIIKRVLLIRKGSREDILILRGLFLRVFVWFLPFQEGSNL